MMLRSCSHFLARGCHSTLRTAPGPGARSFAGSGFKRCSTSVDGFPLHDPAPLFPVHCFAHHHTIKGGLVSLHVCPLLALSEADVLLLVQDPGFTKMAQAPVHVLNRLVVDMKKTMYGCVRDTIEKKQQHCGLCSQRCRGIARAFHEQWVSMVRVDAYMALAEAAPVLWDGTRLFRLWLQFTQGSTMAMRAKSSFPLRQQTVCP